VSESTEILLPAFALWRREVVRFYRNLGRVIGILASPILFWLVIGSGLGDSFRGASGERYLQYFYPGAVTLLVLFTSIFAMMSLIEDRNEGFLRAVLAAPVHRAAIVLGKVLGGATLAFVQGALFLALAPTVGIRFTFATLALSLVDLALTAFALTALGFLIAWPMRSNAGFHAIINLVMLPLWLLSGAAFPVSGADGWMRLLMRLNPLTYGCEALRSLLDPSSAEAGFTPAADFAVLAAFALVIFAAGFAAACRRGRDSA